MSLNQWRATLCGKQCEGGGGGPKEFNNVTLTEFVRRPHFRDSFRFLRRQTLRFLVCNYLCAQHTVSQGDCERTEQALCTTRQHLGSRYDSLTYTCGVAL
jgi:hypothetical protein